MTSRQSQTPEDIMIKLTTNRLLIRDHIAEDLEEHFALLANQQTMKYLPEIWAETRAAAHQNLLLSIEESKKHARTKYFFAIMLQATGKLIGSIGYTVTATNGPEKLVNLGYFLGNAYWQYGYATEAAEKVIEFAFLNNNVVKIETGCLAENSASEKLMIKVGMTKEGELRNHQCHENAWKDRVVYGLLKQEWEKRRRE